jgi:DNA primase
MSQASRFDRSMLPSPADFYRHNVQRFRRVGRQRAVGRCPFHPDRNPSLSLCLDRGLFHCFSCGASGGDVIDFITKRDGIDFKTAAQSLGAWRSEETPYDRKRRQEARRHWDRIERAAEELKRREREERLLARGLIHLLERDKQRISRQLKANTEGDALWEELIATENVLQQELVTYRVLSYGSAELRADYVLHFDRRLVLIREIHHRGYFHDDGGRHVTVLE